MEKISIKRAVAITAFSKYAVVLLNIVFTGILSRILSPQDYGIVAIVSVFTTFFSVLSNLGLGTSVIQYKTLTEEHINHIYTFSFYVSIGLSCLFALLAYPISRFYQNGVYMPICIILSVSVFFNSLNMIPNSVLMREKRFFLVGIRLIIVTVGTFIITVILALAGLKYYALVFQSVASAFLTYIWNKRASRVHLVRHIEGEHVISVARYSAFQFGATLINYLTRNLDKLLIGKLVGDVPLAYYDKAYRFMLYPVHNLTHVISPALHPILSDHQKDKDYIYDKYLKIVKMLSLMGVFITPLCFWASTEIVLVVFGKQWHETARIFRWLSLAIWTQMVTSSTGSIFQSLGKTNLMFSAGFSSAAITLSGIVGGILLSRGDLVITARYIALAYCFVFIITYLFLIKGGFKKSFFVFLLSFKFDFLILAGCMTAGALVSHVFPLPGLSYSELLLSLLYKFIGIATVFAAGILLFYHQEIFKRIQRKTNKNTTGTD